MIKKLFIAFALSMRCLSACLDCGGTCDDQMTHEISINHSQEMMHYHYAMQAFYMAQSGQVELALDILDTLQSQYEHRDPKPEIYYRIVSIKTYIYYTMGDPRYKDSHEIQHQNPYEVKIKVETDKQIITNIPKTANLQDLGVKICNEHMKHGYCDSDSDFDVVDDALVIYLNDATQQKLIAQGFGHGACKAAAAGAYVACSACPGVAAKASCAMVVSAMEDACNHCCDHGWANCTAPLTAYRPCADHGFGWDDF